MPALSGVRVLEALLFALTSTAPYFFLLLHPFRRKLRYSYLRTLLICLVAYGVDCLAYISVILGGEVLITHAVHLAVFVLVGEICIRESPGKIILTVLILANFYVIISTLGTFFEGIFFPEYTMEYYHLSQTLCTVPVALIFLGIDWIYSMRVYEPTMNRLNESHIWYYLWIIPCTFMLFWFTIMFGSEGNDMNLPHHWPTVMMICLITAGCFVTDYVIARLIQEQAERREMEQHIFVAELKQRQFENMNKRIEDARRARHDLRHHLQVAHAYLDSGDLEQLQKYLTQYEVNLPNDTVAQFCKNYTVNALLTYYEQRNMERGVQYEAKMDLPERLPVTDPDLSIIFGNLLENASDAALEVALAEKPALISVETIYRGDMLLISIRNSLHTKPQQDPNGSFRSTKHSGYGIGVDSVREVASKYGGHVDIQFDDNIFAVTVMLYLHEQAKV